MLAILGDYRTIAATVLGALWIHSPTATVLALFVIAARQMAFATLLHAAAHRTLFVRVGRSIRHSHGRSVTYRLSNAPVTRFAATAPDRSGTP